MLYSVIVIQTPQGDMLEYLYPAANGFEMVIYTDPGKRDEMVGHVNVSLRSVVTEGLTADVWEYEARRSRTSPTGSGRRSGRSGHVTSDRTGPTKSRSSATATRPLRPSSGTSGNTGSV
jgi:hypothetical protein